MTSSPLKPDTYGHFYTTATTCPELQQRHRSVSTAARSHPPEVCDGGVRRRRDSDVHTMRSSHSTPNTEGPSSGDQVT